MAEPEEKDAPVPKKSKLPIILGFVFAIIGGGGGFFAASNGMILAGDKTDEKHADKPESKGIEVAYVAVDPLIISLNGSTTSKHLQFRASLEVAPDAKEDVEKILPRVTDVFNSYLRALEPSEFSDPSALTRIRAQMLRRVQVVAGANKINDVLIMEFVLN